MPTVDRGKEVGRSPLCIGCGSRNGSGDGSSPVAASVGRERPFGGRTGLRQGERRKGAAYRAVSVDVRGDGVDSALEPEELPLPLPEHQPGEHAAGQTLPWDLYGGVERGA